MNILKIVLMMGLLPFPRGYKWRCDDVHPCFPCMSYHLKERLGIPLPFYNNRFKLPISLRRAFNFSFLILFLSKSFFFLFSNSSLLHLSSSIAQHPLRFGLPMCFACVLPSFALRSSQVRKSFAFFFSYFLKGFGGGF